MWTQMNSETWITSFIDPECEWHFEFMKFFRLDCGEVDGVHGALGTEKWRQREKPCITREGKAMDIEYWKKHKNSTKRINERMMTFKGRWLR